MSVPVLTFFNNKGGVGKTSLVYHLAWMFAEMGRRVLAVDLDPQANLTAAFLEDDAVAVLWEDSDEATTIYRAIKPITRTSEILPVRTVDIHSHLSLIPGDVALAGFEDTLSDAWPRSMGDSVLFRHFRILTAFWLVAQEAAARKKTEIVLVDVGPNLGAINRSALIASDFLVIPLGADLYSLQGLTNLGPTLRSWRASWQKRVDNWIEPEFELPTGRMEPLGYLVQQHSVRMSRPVKAYDKWINRIPSVYRKDVLEEKPINMKPDQDPYCLAMLKHYRSLIPMGQEARKPIFLLTTADGAIGSHARSAQEAYGDFSSLATRIEREMKKLFTLNKIMK